MGDHPLLFSCQGMRAAVSLPSFVLNDSQHHLRLVRDSGGYLPVVWQATNFVMRQAGLPELTLDRFRAEFALPFSDFYSRMVPHISLDQLEKWFHSHFGEIEGVGGRIASRPRFSAFLPATSNPVIRSQHGPSGLFRRQARAWISKAFSSGLTSACGISERRSGKPREQ